MVIRVTGLFAYKLLLDESCESMNADRYLVLVE